MKRIVIIVGLSLLIVLISCDKPIIGYKYNEGSLPKTPHNLADFNTVFDDYNSSAPSLGKLIPFCFSTNRNSLGNEYDVIYEPMNVYFDKTTGELTVKNEYDNWNSIREDFEVIKNGISRIRTTGNEFGPNLILEGTITGYNFTLMYSTDETGSAQINYISNTTVNTFSQPKEVRFLNSEYDDMYPTFNSERSKIYFCSDREGERFNIYSTKVNPDEDNETILSDTSEHEIIMVNSLSSSSDDKCPFIFADKMVFASDRPGGFGGFDLYYSMHENGEWSEPINFGAKINSASDEYRPILIDEGVSRTQTMMVFSSNREGGAGGFDLYFVGIEGD